MIDAQALVRALNDGTPHAPDALATRLGVPRRSIILGIERLRSMDIEIKDTRGEGYRLTRRLDLLDAQAIFEAIDERTRAVIKAIEVLSEVESTSAHLMRAGAAGAAAGQVCLAERQTDGRGRRGRRWVSPFAANIYMSLLWRFQRSSVKPGRLAASIGVALAEALTSLGATEIALKWPNDVLWRRKKLGGVLVERAGDAGGEPYFVIGIGLNIQMPDRHAPKIDQPWTDLSIVMNGTAPSRNTVAARLLEATIAELALLEENRAENLERKWRIYDCNLGQPVELHTPQGCERGVAMGIDADGRLLMNCGETLRAFTCGEVRLSTDA